MNIERFFTTTFAVFRQTWSGDSSALVSQTSIIGHIQQGTPEVFQQDLGFRFSKAHTIWCAANANIREGDRLTEGSNSYDVRFVINRNIGFNGHLQVIVEKSDE